MADLRFKHPLTPENRMVIRTLGPDEIYDWIASDAPLPANCIEIDNRYLESLQEKKINTVVDWDEWDEVPENFNPDLLLYPAVSPSTPRKIQFHNVDTYNWTLPGLDNMKTNDNCGVFTKAAVCQCGERKAFKRNCHRFVCPECYDGAAVREGRRANERLVGGRHALKLSRFPFRHYVFSPPQDWAVELLKSGDHKKLFQKSNKIISQCGFSGAVVFHPFRLNDSRKDNFNHEIDDQTWFLSPHFHCVGTGYMQKSNMFSARTGWIYKNIRSTDEPKTVIPYLLTHHGILQDGKRHHSVRWLGAYSYNKLAVDDVIIYEGTLPCKKCGSDMNEVFVRSDNVIEWGQIVGLFVVRTKQRIFSARKK